MTRDELRNYIESLRKERDDLELRHQGVRNSSVSCDLAILEERIQRYVAQVKEMEGETG